MMSGRGSQQYRAVRQLSFVRIPAMDLRSAGAMAWLSTARFGCLVQSSITWRKRLMVKWGQRYVATIGREE